MLQQDYLAKMIMQFIDAIRRSIDRAKERQDPRGAAETLETAIGDTTDIDGGVLLSLAPESLVGVMQVSGVDPHVTDYIAHSLLFSSMYLKQAGDEGLARIRESQARAVAQAYGVDLPQNYDEQATETFLQEAENALSSF